MLITATTAALGTASMKILECGYKYLTADTEQKKKTAIKTGIFALSFFALGCAGLYLQSGTQYGDVYGDNFPSYT